MSAYNTSLYGIGVVLSHVMGNHPDKLIVYASCSLSTAEHKYSQLDKETLAILLSNFIITCMGGISLSIVITSH